MKADTWTSPITVEDPQTGVRRTIMTVRQAKAVLDQFWSVDHGSQYNRAEQICDEALRGGATSVRARQAFIAAAVEAHMRLSSEPSVPIRSPAMSG